MMKGWTPTTIGNLCKVKHGWAFKGEYFADEGKYFLLTPGNFHESGGLKLKAGKEKYYSGEFPKEYLLEKGDLLVVMTDLIQSAPILGGSALVPEEDKFLHNQRLGKVIDINEEMTTKDFLYWLFNFEGYRSQIRGSASGATVRHTAPERIYRCKVMLPPLAAQKKIALTLSAYNNLLENNLKRIKLLEEMAQITYEEWFVRLRFPGHESIPINPETGLPDGWNTAKLKDVLVLNYGKALKADNRAEGCIPVYGSSGIVGTHNKAFVEGRGIIVGRKGNVGSVFWSHSSFYPIDTVYFVTSKHDFPFVYYALKNSRFDNSDAAVPGLNRDAAYAVEIILPPVDVEKKFSALAERNLFTIQALEKQNVHLRQARDILLPRLMTGMIDVEHYDPTQLLKDAA
jgi:type I restriction enzyme S subunit